MKKILTAIFLLITASVQAGDIISSDMLSAHNAWRSKVGASALTWSTDLQKKAQNWANKLKTQGCKMNNSDGNLGENLYWASAHKSSNQKDANGKWIWKKSLQPITEKKVITSWGDENKWYDYASNHCTAPADQTCGHYTQLVWKDTQQVGCAKAVCDDFSQVWVCNYIPAGNIQGEKPY